MGPKLVLVVALFCPAALDWLEASAEQACKSSKLTLEEAKQKLSNSSLEPKAVANILRRLEKLFEIDVPVMGLLLFFNRHMCDAMRNTIAGA
jgi:hypothetical protein